MKRFLLAVLLAFAVFSIVSCGGEKETDVKSVLDFEIRNITNSPIAPVSLSQYKGKVVLMVNTATECGHTPQYLKLQELYIRYHDKGLEILAFPSNSFNQEPRTEEEIIQFCQDNYRVSFPMFVKINVKEPGIHPIYEFLTSAETNPEFAGEIKWNFEKFLIGRDGDVIGRFDPDMGPDDPELIYAIEQAL